MGRIVRFYFTAGKNEGILEWNINNGHMRQFETLNSETRIMSLKRHFLFGAVIILFGVEEKQYHCSLDACSPSSVSSCVFI